MTLATKDNLLKINPEIFFVIASVRESDKNYNNNKNIKVIFEKNSYLNCIIRILEAFIPKIFKTKLKNEYLSIIYNSDLIIDVSGDTISDIYPYYLRSTFWRYFEVILFRKSTILNINY